jgi:O-antigen ligase
MANVPTIGFVASHAHNQVVQTLGEAGVVGGAGLLLYVAALLAYGVRYARATNVVALALVSVMLLRGITEPSLNHTLGTGDFYGHFLIFTYLVLASRHDNLTQSCKTGLAGRAS